MSTYGHEPSKTERFLTNVAIFFICGMLAVFMSQPVWRGEDMVKQMRAKCDKVHGIMLETNGIFGTTYECSPRFDKGIK